MALSTNNLERTAEEEFELSCSDDELAIRDGVEWEPKPEEIADLFELLDKHKVLNLEWQCPERRPLTPTDDVGLEEQLSEIVEKSPIKAGFDFEEDLSPKKMIVRPLGVGSGPRGSAKKKTTNLEDILSNMARHMQLDMMDDDQETKFKPLQE